MTIEELSPFLCSPDISNIKLGLGWLMQEYKCAFEVRFTKSVKTVDINGFGEYLEILRARIAQVEAMKPSYRDADTEDELRPVLIFLDCELSEKSLSFSIGTSYSKFHVSIPIMGTDKTIESLTVRLKGKRYRSS